MFVEQHKATRRPCCSNIMVLTFNSIPNPQNPRNVEYPKSISPKSCFTLFYYMGVSWCFSKWWYPQNTPKWSFLVGKLMVVGYHHFRKPPYLVLFKNNKHNQFQKSKVASLRCHLGRHLPTIASTQLQNSMLKTSMSENQSKETK